ncbi:MAG: hypothetical protein HY235_09340 [Acidobacteria bacterium]|nr:hypothetical protein [Acidobacteriota bacterium]
MNLKKYFDLNQPVTTAAPAAAAAPPAPPAGVRLQGQVGIYVFLLLSIIAGRFLDLYRAGVPGTFTLDLGYLAAMSIVSLIAFPVVYERLIINQNQPVLVQLGLIMTTGVGWEKIVATAIGK